MPPDAELVFVGTVVETQAFGQNALIAVDEVWRGDPLPAWQAVVGVDQPDTLWSNNEQFVAGTRYLVVASRFEGIVRPWGCYTSPYSSALDGLRPVNPATPSPAEKPAVWKPFDVPPSGVLPVFVVTSAVLLLTAVGFRFRRQSRTRPLPPDR